MDVLVGDILTMKKPHPCGSKQWKVLRTGMDFKLSCVGCDMRSCFRAARWKKIYAVSNGRVKRYAD